MITDVGKQIFDILDMANGTVHATDICAMVRFRNRPRYVFSKVLVLKNNNISWYY